MTLSTGFLVSPIWRLSCLAALLLSTCLAVWRVMTATRKSLRSRGTGLHDIRPKSVTSNENRTSSRSTNIGTSKRLGRVRIAAMWAVALFAAVMFGMVPVSNRLGYHPTVTKYHVYFPHVSHPMPDREYWYVEASDPQMKLAVFCQPQPFDEGQTLISLSFIDMGDCWQVIHRVTERNMVTTQPILRETP